MLLALPNALTLMLLALPNALTLVCVLMSLNKSFKKLHDEFNLFGAIHVGLIKCELLS